ncbi:MAG TPA: PA14 domain-containing protein, partial [Tepidisphaeraceae bacterium]|nr:PA14 domain-containing protein [Tepidisphaeraceae bacterium]
MSLRIDRKAKHAVSRATSRGGRRAALKSACQNVVAGEMARWESLESRLHLALVHHYQFNEGTGDTTADAVGTNNGTLVGVMPDASGPGVSWRSASPSPAGGPYLHFEAEPLAPNVDTFSNTGGRVDVATSLETVLGGSGSVVSWIRVTPPTGPTDPIGSGTVWRAPGITGNEHSGGANDVFYGWLDPAGRAGMTAGNGASALSSRSIADGSWHLLAVTRDSASGAVRTYIDGVLRGSATSATGVMTGVFQSIGAIAVSATNDPFTVANYNHLNNTDLDAVRLYNHVLTPAEVAAMVGTGALTAPTAGTATVDPANGTRINLSFTDNSDNEAGFIIDRATVTNGVSGPFSTIAQLGPGGAPGSTVNYTDTVAAFNQTFQYRVRAFNTSGESANSLFPQVTSGENLTGAVSAGYLNSNFWGVGGAAGGGPRVWPVDENPNDGVTAGGGEENAGTIRLDPNTPHDPATPTGIAVRDPDVTEIQRFEGEIDPNTSQPVFRQNFGPGTPAGFAAPLFAGAPHPSIRVDNFSTIYTGKIVIPTEDTDGTPGIQVRFVGLTDDDGHLYVNGRLVSTDPNGHGTRVAANHLPAQTFQPGQKLDFILLQAEQGGDANVRMQWEVEGGGLVDVPVSALEAAPSRPGKSGLTLVGTPSSHQVSFTITDNSTSEQRFELYRKLATDPDTAYEKINETGINSPFINDASARPGTAYTYVLRGFNFASGLGEASDPVTATTAAEPAAGTGLHAYYFNDEFWGQGENRPLGRHDLANRMSNIYVGFGENINSADVHEIVQTVNFDFGGNNHDPSVRPGGSPHAQIRDNSFSTVYTGKIRIDTAGEYQILGDTDDDGYVIVDGIVTSSDPFGHGFRDPRITPNRPDRADRFTRPIFLTAGEHDVILLESEQGGGAGARLHWIPPGTTARVIIPATNLSTFTPVPVAGVPTVNAGEGRGTNALVTFVKPAGAPYSELKTVFEIATDAAFTQNYRKIILGAGAGQQFRLFGLAPNTQYFARATVKNFEGEHLGEVGTFNSGPEQAPDAPQDLVARPFTPTQVRLTWFDNSFDETGFVIQRRRVGETDFVDVGTVGANTQIFFDNLDPAQFPLGSQIEYQVRSFNNAGRSGPSNVVVVIVGGPGGTGLTQRIWDESDATNREGVGAPAVTTIDPVVDDAYGTGSPHPSITDPDFFSIEWVGEIIAEETKAYDFSIAGDDGIRLYFNNVLVIDGGWRNQGETEYFSEPISLTAGQRYPVRLQMYENDGGAVARLRWNGVGNVREPIPTAFLAPEATPVDPKTRPVSHAKAFGLAPPPGTTTPQVALRWQDNSFSEEGFQIQRSATPDFATVTELTATQGQDLLVDNDAALEAGTRYHYRIRPTGAPDTAWVTVSAIPNEVTGDFAYTRFNDQSDLTLNNFASTTAEGTIKLTHNQNDRSGSAWFNRTFDLNVDWKSQFDFQIGSGNNADGMAFVIQNFPTDPNSALNAMGGGGGGLAYAGISNSVAVTIDYHDNLDMVGVWTAGNAPPGGGIANVPQADNSGANRPPVGQPHATDQSIDLRNTANLETGSAAFDLDNGTVYRMFLEYDENDNGTPENPADDTGVLTIKIANAATPNTVRFSTQYAVHLPTAVGSDFGLFGFTAATGGLNERHEIHNFSYDRTPDLPGGTVPVDAVYVSGTGWSADFLAELAEETLGDANGFRILPGDPGLDELPWSNINKVAVKFGGAAPVTVAQDDLAWVSGRNIPYAATTFAYDPATRVATWTFNRSFADFTSTNRQTADKINFALDGDAGGANIAGGDYRFRLNVVPGDANRNGNVSPTDYGSVRSGIGRNTLDEGTAPTNYTVFKDINANGNVSPTDIGVVRGNTGANITN